MKMLQYNQEARPVNRSAEWSIGVDRRRVATYVGIALMAGFALGYLAARFVMSTSISTRPLAAGAPSGAGNSEDFSLTRDALEPNQPFVFHRVTRIVKADTIEVEGVGSVRMLGVETPDGKSPQQIYSAYAKAAASFAERNLLNSEVRLEFDPSTAARGNKDDSGQLLAYVYTRDGKLFNGEMIRQGHAFMRGNEPFRKIEDFRALEREAMEAMRGVWGPPDGHQAASSEALNQAPAAQPPKQAAGQEARAKRGAPLMPSDLEVRTPPATALSSDPFVYVSTADRMYHKEGCEYLDKKKKHVIALSEAKGAGYVACGRCFASTVLKAQ